MTRPLQLRRTTQLCLALGVVVLVAALRAAATPLAFTETKLIASDGATGDQFGYAVAVSGDTVAVSALMGDAGPVADSGAVHIFQDTSVAGDWSSFTETKITASDASPGDAFGVAISIEGDTLAVGAWLNEGAGNRTGAAYIFQDTSPMGDWSTFTETKLIASDATAEDRFGRPVSLSGDTLLVGSLFDDDGGENSGSAHVFRDTSVSGDWSSFTETKLTASDPATGDVFANTLFLEGDTALIGAMFNDDFGPESGSAHIFQDTSAAGDWSTFSETRVTPSDPSVGDLFGYFVGLSGDTAVVTAREDDFGPLIDSGAAYVLQDTSVGGDWSSIDETKITASDPGLGDQFGVSASVSGKTLVVGARFDDDLGADSGSVYVHRDTSVGGDWSSFSETKLTASDGMPLDLFGWAVFTRGDTAVVGARDGDGAAVDSGAAYIFRLEVPTAVGQGILYR